MNADTALAVLRREVRKTSQSRLAKRLDISGATLSRWLNGKSAPEGETLEHLIAWAEQIAEPTPEDRINAAVIATADNLARLAEIRGYAQQVLKQLKQIAENQQQVVDSLQPWCDLEDTTADAQLRSVAEATLRAASPRANPAASETPARRRRQAPG